MTAYVLDASAILRFTVATNKDLAEGAATFKYDFKRFHLSTPLQDRWRYTQLELAALGLSRTGHSR